MPPIILISVSWKVTSFKYNTCCWFLSCKDEINLFTYTATIDIKKNIFDLCTDKSDCYLAIIEVCQFAFLCFGYINELYGKPHLHKGFKNRLLLTWRPLLLINYCLKCCSFVIILRDLLTSHVNHRIFIKWNYLFICKW